MSEPRPEDPIIEEVRRQREELFRSAGGSLDALCDALKASEATESREVVKLQARRIDGPDSDAA